MVIHTHDIRQPTGDSLVVILDQQPKVIRRNGQERIEPGNHLFKGNTESGCCGPARGAEVGLPSLSVCRSFLA